MTLADEQKKCLLRMLNFNSDTEVEGWKVLIYDSMGQQIISPILRVGDLKEAGVTLHMRLNTARDPIPDVDAIYFVQPTMENIRMIGEDLKRKLYDRSAINFTSTLDRGLMEELAGLAVVSQRAPTITQLYDQNLNYITLDKNLFSLELSNSFQIMNDPTTSETDIEKFVDAIVSALFSIFGTIGKVPIIKCQKGNVSEHVARKLDSKLRDSILNPRSNLFQEKFHLSRPVLVLMDRTGDLASMLAHSWTYSSLFHDLLDMKLNRVTLNIADRGREVTKTYDIDVNDEFWMKTANLSLPEVAVLIEEETKEYEKAVHNVGDSGADENVGAESLTTAMQLLPELQAKKKTLDVHTSIATALLKTIVERQLDTFISAEESISSLTPSSLLEIIRDTKRNPSDKLRLFLIFFLSIPEVPTSDVTMLEAALKEAGCDVSPIAFAKNVKMYSKMTLATLQQQQTPQNNTDLLGLGSFTSKLSNLTESFQSASISGKFGSLVQGVKNMLPTRKQLPVTQVVDSIMEGRYNAQCLEEYISFDPKSQRQEARPMQRGEFFSDAFVFMIGGGNYHEYQNLTEFCQRPGIDGKSVTYGSTELLSATKFLKQMSPLGLD